MGNNTRDSVLQRGGIPNNFLGRRPYCSRDQPGNSSVFCFGGGLSLEKEASKGIKREEK